MLIALLKPKEWLLERGGSSGVPDSPPLDEAGDAAAQLDARTKQAVVQARAPPAAASLSRPVASPGDLPVVAPAQLASLLDKWPSPGDLPAVALAAVTAI